MDSEGTPAAAEWSKQWCHRSAGRATKR